MRTAAFVTSLLGRVFQGFESQRERRLAIRTLVMRPPVLHHVVNGYHAGIVQASTIEMKMLARNVFPFPEGPASRAVVRPIFYRFTQGAIPFAQDANIPARNDSILFHPTVFKAPAQCHNPPQGKHEDWHDAHSRYCRMDKTPMVSTRLSPIISTGMASTSRTCTPPA